MRNLFIIIALLVGIVCGFFEEFVKININYTIEVGDHISGFYDQDITTKKQWVAETAIDAPFDYYHNHKRIDALLNLNKKELTLLKWLVTLVSIVVFLVINVIILKLITEDRKLIGWFVKLYCVFCLIAGLIFIFGKLTNTLSQSYAVSREIAGGLQSMVPLLIAVPGWWLWKKTQTTPE